MSLRRESLRHMTRREWAVTIAVSPLAAQVVSPIPPQGAPAPPNPTATPQERLQKAYNDVRTVSQTLSKIELAPDVQPAFTFKV